MTKTKVMSFKKWLSHQQKRDDPIGDLAKDVMNDDNWPPRSTERCQQDHLWWSGACLGAHAALTQAWKEYEEYKAGIESAALVLALFGGKEPE